MIPRIIGSGRGVAGMVAYITHDQTSADDRRPTTSERVAWTACLGIPTEDTELMVRALHGLAADAPALKAIAGISARGRKLMKPYTHLVLSWPEETEAPSKQDMLSPVAGALESLGLDHRNYAVCAAHTDTACPHVHVAVSRVDPDTGRAENLDAGATKRLSRWAEEYEREHGGIVVPAPVERRKAQAARRDLERRCRKSGMPREQARPTAARLRPRPPSKPARKRPPLPAGSTPEDRAQWRRLVERQAEQTRRPRTTQEERVECRRREWRTYRAARAAARSTGAAAPSPPRTPSIRKLRADGVRERIELRHNHRAERVSLARRLGRAAVAVWLRSTAAIRKLLRRPPPDVDLEADRRQLDADLADARRRRTEQTRERLAKTARDARAVYDRAYSAFRIHTKLFPVLDSPGSAERKEFDRLITAVEVAFRKGQARPPQLGPPRPRCSRRTYRSTGSLLAARPACRTRRRWSNWQPRPTAAGPMNGSPTTEEIARGRAPISHPRFVPPRRRQHEHLCRRRHRGSAGRSRSRLRAPSGRAPGPPSAGPTACPTTQRRRQPPPAARGPTRQRRRGSTGGNGETAVGSAWFGAVCVRPLLQSNSRRPRRRAAARITRTIRAGRARNIGRVKVN